MIKPRLVKLTTENSTRGALSLYLSAMSGIARLARTRVYRCVCRGEPLGECYDGGC